MQQKYRTGAFEKKTKKQETTKKRCLTLFLTAS
jgi:hypothetical protein